MTTPLFRFTIEVDPALLPLSHDMRQHLAFMLTMLACEYGDKGEHGTTGCVEIPPPP
jgi:hypothetical protein